LIGERARLACIYACKKFTSVSRSDSFGRIRADITMQGYYSRARREMLVRIITERSTSPPPLSLSLSLSLFLFPFLGFPITGFDSALPVETVVAGQTRGLASIARASSALPAEPRLSIILRTAPVTYLIRELTQATPISPEWRASTRRAASSWRDPERSQRPQPSNVACSYTHARTHARMQIVP